MVRDTEFPWNLIQAVGVRICPHDSGSVRYVLKLGLIETEGRITLGTHNVALPTKHPQMLQQFCSARGLGTANRGVMGCEDKSSIHILFPLPGTYLAAGRAGTPATMTSGGTLEVTTEPAPMMAFAPTVTPGRITL